MSEANESGRDRSGRFAAGNKGGPGNPFARRTAAMRKAFAEAVSEEDLAAIARAIRDKAMQGDVAAAKLVLSYAAGKPAEAPDPDTLDAHELETRRRNTATKEDIKAAFEAVPASLAVEAVQAAAPQAEAHMRQAFVAGVRHRMESPPKLPAEGARPDPVLPWLGQGLPEGVSALFELCPAYVHPGDRPAGTTTEYDRMIREAGRDLLARLADRPDAEEGRWTPRADEKRRNR